VTWTNEFSVEVNLLDQQHKKLFQLIEQLRLSMIGGPHGRNVEEVVVALGQYTEAHFFSEERLMRQSGYPDLEKHKLVHASMAGRIERYHMEISQGNPRLADELHAYLVSWWTNHILGTDKRYCGHFVHNGIR
jgi:hemerythrin